MAFSGSSLSPVSFLAYGAVGSLGSERSHTGGGAKGALRFQIGAPGPFRSSLQRGLFASVSAGLVGSSGQPRFSLTRYGGGAAVLADVAELNAADIPDIDPGDLPVDVSSDSEVDSTELDEEEEQALARIKCALCSSSLVPAGQRSGRSRSRRRVDPTTILVCDGCRRCFHRRCAQRRGIALPPQLQSDDDAEDGEEARDDKEDSGWFHSLPCRQSHDRLTLRAGLGAVALVPNFPDHSLQLIDCRATIEASNSDLVGTGAAAGSSTSSSGTQGGKEAHAALQGGSKAPGSSGARGLSGAGAEQPPGSSSSRGTLGRSEKGGEPPGSSGVDSFAAMEQVSDLLMNEYGPWMSQHLQASEYAVLLSHQGRPVTAAVVDVLGQELACVDMMATVEDERGKGHCRALLGGLETLLGEVGTKQLLLACEDDAHALQEAFRSRMGFRKMSDRQVRSLGEQFAHMASRDDATYMAKTLPRPPKTSVKGV